MIRGLSEGDQMTSRGVRMVVRWFSEECQMVISPARVESGEVASLASLFG